MRRLSIKVLSDNAKPERLYAARTRISRKSRHRAIHGMLRSVTRYAIAWAYLVIKLVIGYYYWLSAYPRLFVADPHNAIANAMHDNHVVALRGLFTNPTLVRPLASFVHNHVLPMGITGAPAPVVAPAPPS